MSNTSEQCSAGSYLCTALVLPWPRQLPSRLAESHQPLEPHSRPLPNNAADFPAPPAVVLCRAKGAFPLWCRFTSNPHHSCLEAVRARLFQIAQVSRCLCFISPPRITYYDSPATCPKRSSSIPLRVLFPANWTPWTTGRHAIATAFCRA